MAVAVLYDIHGNLPALEAVLEDTHHAGVTQIVVGGDVLPGPMPRETIRHLLNLSIPVQFIHGNGESEILATLGGGQPNVPDKYREIMRWTRPA